ncbi:MAG: hypothetical protein IPK18_04035 [Sphingobacteriales bacterium]|jgi:hypothetical protein|nr:MAG: hypothetical protein IPK18_04035 [Sphingobacteriales bacterium]
MANYTENVFINIPFDDEYDVLKHAIIFTIYRCGFVPRLASEADDASENRIDKILKIIRDCKFGVHDLSRTEIDKHNLPRFNMPFEYGLFWGAKKFGSGNHKQKIAIVLEKERYSLKKYLSDTGGADEKAHNNDPKKLIKIIRDWLFVNTKIQSIPSSNNIIAEFDDFYFKRLAIILFDKRMQIKDLLDVEFCKYSEEAVEYLKKNH